MNYSPDKLGTWRIEYEGRGTMKGCWMVFQEGLSLEFAIERMISHVRFFERHRNRGFRLINRVTNEIIPVEAFGD